MSTDLVAVNPATGEVLENLDKQPPEALAEALNAINLRETELKRWRGPLESELRRRLKIRQAKLAVFGEWEVEAPITRERNWDADALEAAMQRLADEGVVPAGEMTGVITREPVVVKSKAKAVLDRLDGEARQLVQACFEWKENPGKLTVTRSVALLPETAEEAPREPGDVDRSGDGDVDGAPPTPAEPPQPPSGPPAESSQSTLDPEELFA